MYVLTKKGNCLWNVFVIPIAFSSSELHHHVWYTKLDFYKRQKQIDLILLRMKWQDVNAHKSMLEK